MRVLTFNIHSGREGVDRVTGVLLAADADVLMLTEVRRGHLRTLARSVGMRASFVPTWRWRRFGNAILSREPHRRLVRRRFTPTPGRQRRGMLAVRLRSGLVAAVTHLGLDADERVRHAHELLGALADVRGPLVLAGDLNDRPEGPAVAVLLARFHDAFPAVGAEPAATYPADMPRHRIDYILVSGVEVRGAAVIPTIASDHLAVTADLAYVASSDDAS